MDVLVGSNELSKFFDEVFESTQNTKIFNIVRRLQLTFTFQELFDGPVTKGRDVEGPMEGPGNWQNFTRALVQSFGYPAQDIKSLANVSFTLQPVLNS